MRWTNLAMAMVGCVLLAQAQGQAQGQAQVQAAEGDPALLGHWPFEEGYGIFSADKGPHGRDAMLHGASWAAGGFGKALRCDGELLRVAAAHARAGWLG